MDRAAIRGELLALQSEAFERNQEALVDHSRVLTMDIAPPECATREPAAGDFVITRDRQGAIRSVYLVHTAREIERMRRRVPGRRYSLACFRSSVDDLEAAVADGAARRWEIKWYTRQRGPKGAHRP